MTPLDRNLGDGAAPPASMEKGRCRVINSWPVYFLVANQVAPQPFVSSTFGAVP